MIFLNYNEIPDTKTIEIDVKGSLDSSTAVDFEDYINNFISSGKINFILNLKNLEYISSGGIGNFLYLQKRINALNGLIVLCDMPSEIKTLFNLLGFGKIFNVAETKQNALLIIKKHNESQAKTEKPGIYASESNKGNMTGKHASSDDNIFKNPIIMECAKCKGMIRVSKSGHYICPDCKGEFFVDQDQNVTF